jgi:hypothetical protein
VRTGWAANVVRRRVLAAAALVAVVALVALAGVLLGDRSRGGTSDPRSAKPGGSLAIAELLRDRGVNVRRVTDEGALRAGTGTVVVPLPARLDSAELRRLADGARGGGDLVLVAPASAALEELGVPATTEGDGSVRAREPGCGLREARTAGVALVGGQAYRGGAGTVGCYPTAGGDALVVVSTGAGRIVLVGGDDLIRNDQLADEGNAALALGLLGRHPTLDWFMPPPGRAEAVGARDTLVSLLPDRVTTAAWQCLAAVAVLALWRVRRLGPPVAEALPVVVRAAEAVEGRARLYGAARAHAQAARALRAGARARLAAGIGLGDGAVAGARGPVSLPGSEIDRVAGGAVAEPDPTLLTSAVAVRTGLPPWQVAALLYGAGTAAGPAGAAAAAGGEPADDAALVRLADDLDRLDRQVLRS